VSPMAVRQGNAVFFDIDSRTIHGEGLALRR
jgi:hypothetical protein